MFDLVSYIIGLWVGVFIGIIVIYLSNKGVNKHARS
jgi:hypothetical protein